MWINSFSLVNYNNLTLVNILLFNSLNSIHPFLTHICISFIYCLLLNSLYKFNNLYLNLWFINYYWYIIKCSYICLVFNISLSMWWAFQEGTWDGWWSWDISEVIIIFLIYFFLILLHSNYLFNRSLIFYYILIQHIFILYLFYKIIKIFFIWNLHTFFDSIFIGLWSFNNIYWLFFILSCLVYILKKNINISLNYCSIKFNDKYLYSIILLFYFNKFYLLLTFYSLNLLNILLLVYILLYFWLINWTRVYLQHIGFMWIYIIINLNYYQIYISFYWTYTLYSYLINIYVIFLYTLNFNYIIKLYWYYFSNLILSNLFIFNLNTYIYVFYIYINIFYINLIFIFYENLNFINLFILYFVYFMDFLYYYNWLRFSILTPSYFAKNRLLVERTYQNRLIYSFFGFTQKSFIWTQISNTVISNYLWKNIYYGLFLIFGLLFICILISFNFFIFNFPVKYWFIYICWRLFDGFYFFFLQCQYLFIICLLSSSWYVLNTYFNIQLNLLYLIIFNYFSINTDIQVTNIAIQNPIISYTKSMQNLFAHNLIINNNLLSISFYFYSIKLYLNSWSIYSSTFYINFVTSYWVNFKFDSQINNFWNSNRFFYLSNIITHRWFLYLNTNSLYLNNLIILDYTNYVSNWYKILKIMRWNILNINTYNTSIIDLKSLVSNYYLKSINADIDFKSWLSSVEWILYRWLMVLSVSNIKSTYIFFNINTNINVSNTWGVLINKLNSELFFNKYSIMNKEYYQFTDLFINRYLNLNFDIFTNIDKLYFFSPATYYYYYYWMSNISLIFYNFNFNYNFDSSYNWNFITNKSTIFYYF